MRNVPRRLQRTLSVLGLALLAVFSLPSCGRHAADTQIRAGDIRFGTRVDGHRVLRVRDHFRVGQRIAWVAHLRRPVDLRRNRLSIVLQSWHPGGLSAFMHVYKVEEPRWDSQLFTSTKGTIGKGAILARDFTGRRGRFIVSYRSAKRTLARGAFTVR